ncbi:MAG: asparagine synthase (glutamine-hydrolyzing) [Blastocatellia bacterium AA13]|nr:MAG: asparagine synthase (glutamine-hydrolyzing) [Blastocatellia bacterium AA13]
MCGIAGLTGEFSGLAAESAIRAMLDSQIHRGPDDDGMFLLEEGDAVIGLGSRRLAILDVSAAGKQPMVNPDTGDALVFNGEIYNFKELRRSLESFGYAFRSGSDTEVILRGYEQYGRELLSRLSGMYALAVWDRRASCLLLARDHLGIKPLYYSLMKGGGLIFSSEIRSLLASFMIAPEVNQKAVAGYLAYGSVQEPLTIIEGVAQVPAGAWIEADASGRITGSGVHWSIPETEPGNTSIAALAEEGRCLLESAVASHLVSDVPSGIFLSSGLDSTAILGLARKRSQEVHAFTVSFPDDPDFDERSIALSSARRLGAVYHEFPIESRVALDWTREGLDRMDQPTMDGLNTYIVSRAVREQGITVALSGQGGDEVFGGYRSFRGVPRWRRRAQWMQPLPQAVKGALAAAAASYYGRVVQKKFHDLARSGPDLSGIYFHYRRLMSNADLESLGFTAESLGLSPSFHLAGAGAGTSCIIPGDGVASVSRLESVFYLGNTLLRDGDVFGMANSVEIRVPFLDKELVDWAFRIPGDALLPEGAPPKFLLRRMCGEFYSPEQIYQKKRGFTLPLSRWLLGPLRGFMENCLESVKESGLVDPEGVDRLVEVFVREPQTAAWSRVWSLVALGHWLSMHLARAAAGSPAQTALLIS